MADGYARVLGRAGIAKAAIPESNPLNVGVCGTYSRECANRVVAAAHTPAWTTSALTHA